jgi:hypothetical protein
LGVFVTARTFRVVLIKPSHYDEDGYVIQWRRSTVPSNSLASVYGLVDQCARERVLGADIDIEIEACDQCNTVVDVAAAVRSNAAFAPSSMSKAASRVTAPPTTSRRSCAPMRRRASPGFSSPTTISPATATGNRYSTA